MSMFGSAEAGSELEMAEPKKHPGPFVYGTF
jgi:hypothetical protein